MRDVGDHRWLNTYIGKTYLPGGRGPEQFDCYGLCKTIYNEVFNIELPDWRDDLSKPAIRAGIIAGVVSHGTFTELEDPVDGCFVVCYRSRAAYHIGLFFAGGVIHADEGHGVIYEPLSRFARKYTKLQFGDWHP